MKKYRIDINQLNIFSDFTAPKAPVRPEAPALAPEKTALPNVPQAFEVTLKSATKLDWELIWTQNRSTLISFWRNRRPPCLRIHQIFKSAPAGLALIISEVIEGRLQPWPREIDEYIRNNMQQVQDMRGAPRKERAIFETAGRYHNIGTIYDELNRQYFGGSIKSKLAWMLPRSRRPRSLHLGNYTEQGDIIKIHPILDSREVPAYVIADTVFHEMTHAFLKTRTRNGRRITHGRDFRRKMEEFPQHAAAEAWLEANISKLLRNYSRLAAQVREVRDRAEPSADARRR